MFIQTADLIKETSVDSPVLPSPTDTSSVSSRTGILRNELSVKEYINNRASSSAQRLPGSALPFLHTIHYLHKLTMMKLTGIKAFEACWSDLRESYKTPAADNHLIMQSMGRLVDNYASQEEIEATLPAPLKTVFASLVDAYLNGYWIEDTDSAIATTIIERRHRQVQAAASKRSEAKSADKPVMSPAMLAAAQRKKKKQQLQPTASSEAATYIIRERAVCVAF